MRCGGPGMCPKCSIDAVDKEASVKHNWSAMAASLWDELGQPLGNDGLRIINEVLDLLAPVPHDR